MVSEESDALFICFFYPDRGGAHRERTWEGIMDEVGKGLQ